MFHSYDGDLTVMFSPLYTLWL